RSETSLYTAIPALALLYGSSLLDSLDERMGGQRAFGAGATEDDDLFWGRVIGLDGSRYDDGSGIYGALGPRYDYDLFAMQAGGDLYRAEHDDGSRDNAGFYLAFGRAGADVLHATGGGAGAAVLTGWTLGGYWTHVGAGGWYLDGVVQGSLYDVTASG